MATRRCASASGTWATCPPISPRGTDSTITSAFRTATTWMSRSQGIHRSHFCATSRSSSSRLCKRLSPCATLARRCGSSANHRADVRGPAVLPLRGLHLCARSAACQQGFPRQEPARTLRRRRRGDRLECRPDPGRASRPGIGRVDPRRLHQRQRSLAEPEAARRLGRSAPRGEGLDLGRGRPRAMPGLVARHDRTGRSHSIWSASSTCSQPAWTWRVRRSLTTGRSTASRWPPLLRGTGPSPRTHLFYYHGADLFAVRRGPWKLHLKTIDPASGKDKPQAHDPPLALST